MSTGVLAEFYKSRRWKMCRNAYLSGVNYVCERCGAPAYIVHHLHHLDPENVGDPDVALNPNNLQAVCLKCHNEIHFKSDACVDGLGFDADGNLVETGTRHLET